MTPLPPAARPAPPHATLVVLGGGDDDPTLALLATLLPDRAAPIEIVTTATYNAPDDTYRAYARAWHALGFPRVGHLRVDEHHAADHPATLARLRAARLVFFSGGDQERLTEFLLQTEFLDVLRARFAHDPDFVLAGTSAGAVALGEHMIVEGVGWRSLLKGGTHVVPGLGLLPGLLLDSHFIERARYPRLLHALLAHPALLGLGLSEETGLILRPGHPAEVFGDNVVVAVDARAAAPVDLAALSKGQPLGARDLRLHLLVAGDTLR